MQALWTKLENAAPTGIARLDATLNLFQQHAHAASRKRTPVVELVSDFPAAGKTHLLYLLIAAAVLPQTSTQDPGTAVVVDTDNRFDVERLVQVMTSYYRSQSGAATPDGEELPPEVLHALEQIHLLRPQSLASLISTLQQLPQYLLHLTQHRSANRRLNLLAIDSITAFYWPERFEQDMADLEEDSPEKRRRRSLYVDLVEAVRNIQSTFQCPVLVTSMAFSSASKQAGNPTIGPQLRGQSLLRSLMPLVWNHIGTVRLAVGREDVKKFPRGLTLQQAERDRVQRQEVVERARFWVSVDMCGAENWPDALREKLRRHARGRSFGFSIRQEGVIVDA